MNPVVMLLLLSLLLGNVAAAQAERIKDIVSISGIRNNQLIGYGLVVGLDGTGDQTTQAPFTSQSLINMLNRFNIRLPDNANPQLKNVAAVSVHAELPAFRKTGQTIDVTVSSIGNAKSLRGGSLLMTPLMGLDGNVYAIAQGNMVVGGLGVSGNDGSNITVNVPSTGRIANGAIVEREVPTVAGEEGFITLNLHNPDFTTGKRMSMAINEAMGPGTAEAIDIASIRVHMPDNASERVAFVSTLENLTLVPGESAARIVVNSRTGTVVIGQHVRVNQAAVSHGSLTVRITERPGVSQPEPFSRGGTTVVVPRTEIDIEQKPSRMFLLDPGVALGDIVSAINQVGASPADLIAILEALKIAGAIRAELVIL